jgi:hypothetical protein
MTDRKYTCTGSASYFAGQVKGMKAEEAGTFAFLEAKSTLSIVRKITKAAEASKPRLRYVASWIQGLGIRLAPFLEFERHAIATRSKRFPAH